jgi:hypothetical protein
MASTWWWFDQSMTTTSHTAVDDRHEILGLINGWAHHADRRQPQQQAELFTSDGVVLVFESDPGTSEAVARLQGRPELAEAFKVLDTYDTTTHFNGQSQIVLDGDTATAESYCLAHHVWMRHGRRTLMVMSIRYLDAFVRDGGKWLFAERRLVTDWTDTRPLTDQ